MSVDRRGVFIAVSPCGCIRAAADDDCQEGIEEIRHLGELKWFSNEDYSTTPLSLFRCTHKTEATNDR